MVKSTEAKQKNKKRLKGNEDNLRDLWNINHINIHAIGIPEEEITAENSPYQGWRGNIKVQEVQRVSHRINPKMNIPRHIVIKVINMKDEECIKKSKGKATNSIQGNSNQGLSANFSV